jgi:predicted PurR-regulated permease PerM
MVLRDKIIFWLLGIVALGVFLYAVKAILLPFVVAVIVAFFLDPAADVLERLKLSRNLATLVITAVFFVIFAAITVLVAPLLYDQLLTLAHQIPGYIDFVNHSVVPYFSDILTRFDPDALAKAKESVSGASVHIFGFVAKFLSGMLTSGIAVVNLLSLIFITPIVTFYILRDWDCITAKVVSFLPKKHKDVVCEQASLIDRALSGYIRGQTNVCLILGVFYAVGLSLLGLDFALLIGIATGLLCFIPYVGVFFGLIIGTLVAYFQFSDISSVLAVVAVFLVGQFLEGNFLSPKLIGDKVGLHPVWIMFGLLSGAAMFGFIGVLVAIPISAILVGLIRFFLGR